MYVSGSLVINTLRKPIAYNKLYEAFQKLAIADFADERGLGLNIDHHEFFRVLLLKMDVYEQLGGEIFLGYSPDAWLKLTPKEINQAVINAFVKAVDAGGMNAQQIRDLSHLSTMVGFGEFIEATTIAATSSAVARAVPVVITKVEVPVYASPPEEKKKAKEEKAAKAVKEKEEKATKEKEKAAAKAVKEKAEAKTQQLNQIMQKIAKEEQELEEVMEMGELEEDDDDL